MDKPHVLVIEDDISVCELLFACLSKADYRVSIAQSGEAGLQQIEEDPPVVVVLDLSLPGMNGLDVCRAMRRDPWMSKLPVLMLTGKAEEEDIVTGLECTVFKIVNRDHRDRVMRSLYVRLTNDPLNRIAFVSIDAENKIETAARFSNNS